MGGRGGGNVVDMVVLSIFTQKGICFASQSADILIYSSAVKCRKTMGRDVTDTVAARSVLAHDVISRTLRSSLDGKKFLCKMGWGVGWEGAWG